MLGVFGSLSCSFKLLFGHRFAFYTFLLALLVFGKVLGLELALRPNLQLDTDFFAANLQKQPISRFLISKMIIYCADLLGGLAQLRLGRAGRWQLD